MYLCWLVVLAACDLSSAEPSSTASKSSALESPPYDGRFDAVDELPQASNDLRYAFVIFRHGIRSPLYKPFQTDSEYDAMWPEGLGALTNDGKRLMFHVGHSLKTRYSHLLPENGYEDKVQFTSTHSDRALKSAACVAAGMFRSKEYPILEEDAISSSQPVSVLQNILYDKHKLFSQKVQKSECKKYTEIREQIKDAEINETPEMRKKYYGLLNDCISKTFHGERFAGSLPESSQLYDTFKAQILNKKSVPNWVPTVMPVMEKMKQLRMWYLIHSQPNLIQYFIGPLFYQIIREMEDLMTKPEANMLKLHFHGSHDITVMPTVWTISRDETYLALPGDTVMIEMDFRGNVKVYLYAPLQEDKSKRFKNISLEPLCGASCAVTDFKNELKERSVSEADWSEKCNDKTTQASLIRPIPQDIDMEDLNIMKEAQKL